VVSVPRGRVIDRDIIEICEKFKRNEDVYNLCTSGVLYETARGLVDSEVSAFAHDPEDYADSLNWELPSLTPKQKECIELEATFSKKDVLNVMEALAEAMNEGKGLDEAIYDDDVWDVINNISAKNFKDVLEECGVKI